MKLNYESIRHNLSTGDIVLFSGKGPISASIKLVTKSKWSHVGMVVCLDEYDFITVWESTQLGNIKDLETGKFKKGVQVVPLSLRLTHYDGEIAIRHLQNVNLSSSDIQELMRFRKEMSGRSYEKNTLELLKSAYDGPLGENTEDLSSLFCSELVAESYQKLGLLPSNIASNEYTPANFSTESNLELLKGRLSDEIYLPRTIGASVAALV